MFQIPLQTQCRGHFQYLTSYLFGEVRKPAIRCNAKTRQFGLKADIHQKQNAT